MKIASIDTGTNTVLMLIAEVLPSGHLRLIKELHTMPRMGEGVFQSGEIKEEKISLLCDIYSNYAKEAYNHGVDKIIACGTNVFRIAGNREEVRQRVKEASGIEMEIIDGGTEAECSFLGATADFDRSNAITVIDIGGGSTEITCKRGSELLFQKSFSTGVVTLRENLIDKEMMTDSNLRAVESYCADFFRELHSLRGISGLAISIAGTPTTLLSISKGLTEFNAEKLHKQVLTVNEIRSILDEFTGLKFTDYFRFGKIIIGREDLMSAGAIILSSVLSNLGLTETHVSVTGLRYGLILRYLNSQKQEHHDF